MSSTLRKCLLACIAAALGATTVLLPALAGAEAPPIEPVEQGSPYPTFYWSRSSEEVPIGGQVVFKNPSTSVPHGLEFEGAAKPSCSGAPAGAGATSWQASCTFSAPGKYTFYCTVHPSTMRGTITVAPGGTTTTTTTTTSPGGTTGGGTGTSPYPLPGAGAPAGSVPLFVGGTNAVKLSAVRHGGGVRGALAVAPAGAGGTLQVDVLARRGALAAHSAATVRIGQLKRYYVAAGPQSFTIKLTAAARRALRRHGRLAVMVRVALIPPGAAAQTLTRALTLRR